MKLKNLHESGDSLILLKDKVERMRSSTLHKIEQEIELLEIGLHALNKNKPHVTVDHMERSIDALKKLAGYLNTWWDTNL